MVKAGIDRVTESGVKEKFKGKNIGLIAGASGLSQEYLGTIEVMSREFQVTALFAPEHGPRGVLGPGEKVSDGVDELSGIKVYSLFEDFVFSGDENAKKSVYSPKPDALKNIDRMVFDMQDAGSRFFTFSSTLFYVMQSCAAASIPVTVLDRPNPIGGATEGNLMPDKYSSFIGLAGLPIRHGMTMGELALFFNGEYKLGCDLEVVGLDGWKKSMFYDEIGLPFVKPSPNLPTLDSITVYSGTCMLAGTNVSEGRGTTTPFTTVGAPYIDPLKLAGEMNALSLAGLRFSPAFFVPQFSKYSAEICRGVDIHITDKHRVKPVELGVRLIKTIEKLYPDQFAYNAPSDPSGRWHIDLSAGGTDLRDRTLDADGILEKWRGDAEVFAPAYEKYRLYD